MEIANGVSATCLRLFYQDVKIMPMKYSWFITAISTGCIFTACEYRTAAHADTLVLKNDGVLSGSIKKATTDSVVIQTSEGILVQVEKTQIAKQRVDSDSEKAYVASLKDRPDDADNNRAIARECLARSQKSLSDAHYERLVELDPSDGTAWSAIGYIKDVQTGQMVRRDALMHRRGIIRYTYRGKSPETTIQAAAIAASKEKAARMRADITRLVEVNLKNLRASNQKLSFEAREFFNNLNDPLAIGKIKDLLVDSVRKGGNWGQYFDILLRMPGQSATGTFIDLASDLNMPQAVVDACLEALMRTETSRDIAMVAFLGKLSGKIVAVIDRAGNNLEVLGDERTIPSLIDALNTPVSTTIQKPPNSGIDSTGSVQQAFGPQTETINGVANQPGVLAALTKITGQSFSYNEIAWRQWFAMTYAKTNLDLRRFE
jgi:hypothetical protein